MDSKKRMIIFAVTFMVLAVTAIGLFAVVLTQRNAAPENASADIAPVTETIELDTTKILSVKTLKEVLPTGNIVAGETYEVSGKVRRYPTTIMGDFSYYNYSNTEVGIILQISSMSFPISSRSSSSNSSSKALITSGPKTISPIYSQPSTLGTRDIGLDYIIPRIYSRINKDNTFKFRFVAAETTDIGKYIQIKPDGLFLANYPTHIQVAYTTLTSGKGYLGTTSKVIK